MSVRTAVVVVLLLLLLLLRAVWLHGVAVQSGVGGVLRVVVIVVVARQRLLVAS